MSAKKDKSERADAASSNGSALESTDKPECFVIMPISDPDGYERGHFGQVFDDLFAPACDRAGYRAVRADQVRQTNLIHLDVLQKIVESPMALCDLSNRNPNVMFELGLRQAFDKPVVLVQELGTPPIFDITPLRYAEYHKEMLYRQVIEDQESITSAILATKEAIKNSKSVNSIVKLLSITQAASLTNVTDADKDTAYLQVIMAEISNLRAEIGESRGYRTDRGRARTNELGSWIKDQRVATELEVYSSELRVVRDYLEAHDPTQEPSSNIIKRIDRIRQDISRLSDYIMRNVNDPIAITAVSKLEREAKYLEKSLQHLVALYREGETSRTQQS